MRFRVSGAGGRRAARLAAAALWLVGAAAATAADRAIVVTLDAPAVFQAPDGASVRVAPGDYAVEAAGDTDLRLTPIGSAKGVDGLLLDADTGIHELFLVAPAAVSVAGEGEGAGARHIVLMLPGGEQREAIGSDGEVTTRGAVKLKLPAGAVGKASRSKLQGLRPESAAKLPKLQFGAGPAKGAIQAAAAGAPVPGGFHRLTTEWLGDGKSLDIVNDGVNDQVTMADSGNYTGQAWKLTPWDGYYRITSQWLGDGKSLDIVNDGVNDQLVMADSGNYSGQSWKLTPWEGYYRLTNEWLGDGKSLDIVNDGENRRLVMADSGNYTGQAWKIVAYQDVPDVPGGVPGEYCVWKTSDIIDARIDIGAQYSLMRKMGDGPPVSRDASAMIGAIKSGELAGILLPPRQAVSERGQRMSPPRGYWQLIPSGQDSICLKEPAGEPPMIVYREKMTPDRIDRALSDAWRQCGLATPDPPCDYIVDRFKPPPGIDLPPLTAGLTVIVLADGAPVSGAEVGVAVVDAGYSESATTGSAGTATFEPPGGIANIWVYPPSSDFKMAVVAKEITAGTSDGIVIELERQETPKEKEKTCDNDTWHDVFNECGKKVALGASKCVGSVYKDYLKCSRDPRCVAKILPKFWKCREELDHKRKIQDCVDKANAASNCSHPGP
jgi:hypothetical protein